MNMHHTIRFALLFASTSTAIMAAENQENLVREENIAEISRLVEQTFSRLELGPKEEDVETLVSIADAVIKASREAGSDIPKLTYLEIIDNIINYQSSNIEVRLALYNVQTHLVSQLIAMNASASLLDKVGIVLGGFQKNIEERLIADFQPPPVYINIPPPQTDKKIGMNPASVEDPEIRAQWEKAIRDNERNALINKEQRRLQSILEVYGPKIVSYRDK